MTIIAISYCVLLLMILAVDKAQRELIAASKEERAAAAELIAAKNDLIEQLKRKVSALEARPK